jgi:hypothetical protein
MGAGVVGVLAPARLAPALGLSEVKAVREVKVATLWAGYGSISEVTVVAGGNDAKSDAAAAAHPEARVAAAGQGRRVARAQSGVISRRGRILQRVRSRA